MSESQYYWNIFKMIIIWTTSIFSTYLVLFQLKYIKGNIYENTKYYAISDAISRFFGGVIYNQFGIMKSFIISFAITLIGAIVIYLVDINYIILENIKWFGYHYTVENTMPELVLVLKFGLGSVMLATYTASFCEDQIFPAKKRATATAICNIIARSLTILAPQVNELKDPLPKQIFIVILTIGLISSFSFINLE